jgi:hypothetical protein
MGESRRERRALARVNRKAEKLAGASPSPDSFSHGVHRARLAVIFVGGLVLGLSIAFWITADKKADATPVVVTSKADNEPKPTLGRLTELPDSELAGVDIALMNLLCSEGLPGRDETNGDAYLLRACYEL